MSRSLPPLNALRAFEAAARLESVTQAAVELHVTHGAISRHIHALEASLGTALFTRAGRGLALTPAGQRLRDGSSVAFDQLQQCCRAVQRGAADAPFVLGCSGSVLARWVIPRLARLQHDLPGAALHLSILDAPPGPAMPELDAALLLAEPPWPPAWQVHTLARERIGPVVGPRHPRIAALRKGSMAALAREPLLHTTSRPQAWPTWARARRITTGKLRFGQAFEHLYYMLAAAVSGLGVAIAPQPLVADDLADGHLLAPWGFAATRASWVLCAPHASADPRLVALAAWLRRELNDATGPTRHRPDQMDTPQVSA